jgi:hypothetical protein
MHIVAQSSKPFVSALIGRNAPSMENSKHPQKLLLIPARYCLKLTLRATNLGSTRILDKFAIIAIRPSM